MEGTHERFEFLVFVDLFGREEFPSVGEALNGVGDEARVDFHEAVEVAQVLEFGSDGEETINHLGLLLGRIALGNLLGNPITDIVKMVDDVGETRGDVSLIGLVPALTDQFT